MQLYLKRDSGTGGSYEFCEISKNTFLTEPLWATASGRRLTRETNLF